MKSDTLTKILLTGVLLALIANAVALLARPQVALAQAPQPLTAIVTRWEKSDNWISKETQWASECTVFFANGATSRFSRSNLGDDWKPNP